MSKYYRPEDEEFCIGFEVETKTYVYPGKWEKQIIDEGRDIDAIFGYAEDYRVKYLDRQDIIDLGWEYRTNLFYKNILFKKQQFSLVYNYSTCNVMISKKECNCNSHPNVHYFNGKIKNKSELKKIMQMIGIV
jgi:hypothetical protein